MQLEANNVYTVQYLPSAMQDLTEIVHYIAHDLNNPAAASHLAEEFVTVAEKLEQFPYAFPTYIPLRPLKKEYRKLPVQNYIMFYWVNEADKTVTIARVLYSRRNYTKILK